MQIIYLIVGAVIGFFVGQNGLGTVAGAAVGYLFGELFLLKNKTKAAEEQLKILTAKFKNLQAESIALAQDDTSEASKEKEEAQVVDPYSSDKYVQAIKKAAIEREQSELTIPEEEIGDTPSLSQPPKSSPKYSQYKQQESKFSQGISNLLNTIVGFFTTGNVLVKVGVVVLFFGFSFLIKLAVENSIFPVEYRLIAVAIGGIAMLVFGWRLREKRSGYAVAIQGGGIGLLYLTVYAAFRLYNLLPATVSFGVLVLIAITSAIISVQQNSRTLAILSTVGGFLAPVLASTGQGSHVALFSYYIVLNFGVLFVAWFKSWRLLNVISFVFTFVIATLWGYKAYRPEHFISTEPFLLVFFLIFTMLAVLYAIREKTNVKSFVDGTIVFGTPLITFALQAKLVENTEYGLAFSALGFAFYYIVLAYFLYKKLSQEKYLLPESFLSIGIVFATLTIPFAFEGHITSALWALEGAAIVWIGARQSQWLARVFGLLLLVLASAIFILDLDIGFVSKLISTNDYLGSIILFVASLFAGHVLHKNKASVSAYEYPFISHALLVSGLALWTIFGIAQIFSLEFDGYILAALLSFFALTMLGCLYASKWLKWPQLSYFIHAILPLLGLMVLLLIFDNAHPSIEGGWAGWPIALGALYWCLYQFYKSDRNSLGWIHAGGLLITLIIVTWELGWRIEQVTNWSQTWDWMIWGMIPSVALWCLCAYGSKLEWPVLKHRVAYINVGASIIAVYVIIWAFFMNVSGPGNPAPLPYIPFLNPVDISTLIALFALVKYYQTIAPDFESSSREMQNIRAVALLLIGLFVWVNAFVLRTIHFWKGVPYDLDIMLSSQLVQATFSILWASIAVIIMVFSSKKLLRSAWIVGAGLIGVVVVKLFLVDLSNSQTMERIIAFIVVGGLLLLVGYMSPVPPKAAIGDSK